MVEEDLSRKTQPIAVNAGRAKTDDNVSLMRPLAHKNFIDTDNSRTRTDEVKGIVFTHTANHFADLRNFSARNGNSRNRGAVIKTFDQRPHKIRMRRLNRNVIEQGNWFSS